MNAEQYFYVKPMYDDENDVYYSESNIIGLHLQTDTLDEFYEEARKYAIELLEENHGIKSVIFSESKIPQCVHPPALVFPTDEAPIPA